MSGAFERCAAFYGDVFGWDRHPIGGEVPYVTNGEGDNAVCGIGGMTHCDGLGAVPGWRVHFGVTNPGALPGPRTGPPTAQLAGKRGVLTTVRPLLPNHPAS